MIDRLAVPEALGLWADELGADLGVTAETGQWVSQMVHFTQWSGRPGPPRFARNSKPWEAFMRLLLES